MTTLVSTFDPIGTYPQHAKVIVTALIMGLSSIGYIAVILMLFYYVFAILGMILFGAYRATTKTRSRPARALIGCASACLRHNSCVIHHLRSRGRPLAFQVSAHRLHYAVSVLDP